MSKKLIYIRIIVIAICICFIGLFVILLNNITKSVDANEVIIEETTKEEKIIFDLKKSPKEQKGKLRGHVSEYEDQVYHYLFDDEKIINTAKYTKNYLDYYDLIEGFKSIDNIMYIYKRRPLNNLISMVFSDKDIDYSQYAFTDNYIQNHPLPLRQEYKKYFKDNYEEVKDNGKFKHLFTYDYSIGIDREKKQVEIEVKKFINFYNEEMRVENGVLWGKKGSKYEGRELYDTLRKIYFDYTLDEKGYLDDVKYSHTQIINDEKEFDASCPEYQ